ncbi:MAG: hypothetical protein M3Y41_21325 [Pseudomonadota bacterium]|nr:hypothetical protein [Pseudomonadota bacterium]
MARLYIMLPRIRITDRLCCKRQGELDKVERLILTALTPEPWRSPRRSKRKPTDRAAVLAERERACHDTERGRRQYGSVDPENRVVARSLERVWEEQLRHPDQIEQEYAHGVASR